MRLVIPFIGGILISDTVVYTGNQTRLILCILIPVLFLTFIFFAYFNRLSRLYGLSLSLSFFLTGAFAYDLHVSRVTVKWPTEISDYMGFLTDWPYERAASYRLDLTLTGRDYSGVRIFLYVPKDSTVKKLIPGETVLFRGAISEPDSDSIVGFDYSKFLYRHGVSGTLWVNSSYWKSVPGEKCGGVRTRAAVLRRSMFERYQEWGLEGNHLALVSAVSLGYKRELDERVRELYATSGGSHLLAVSGLHVGIIYSFLYFLFPFFLNRRSLLWLRELIVICIMWGFAFITGMPDSIIRSVIMFSLLSVSKVTGRNSSSVNTLGFAALVMLVANPASLFDIGFRLSFCAVLSILLFEPLISSFIKMRTIVGNQLKDYLSLSIAAQIGTAPMVIYSFTGFPTYFMLTNIISVPIMSLIIVLSISLWSFSWLVPMRNLIVESLSILSNLQDRILSYIITLPHSRIDVSIDALWKVWALYGVIIFVYCWLKAGKTTFFVKALWIIAIWSTILFITEVM